MVHLFIAYLFAAPSVINRTVLVCNDEMYTLAQVDAVRKKLPVFQKHLAVIFENVKNRKEVVEVLTKHCLIRSALAEQGRQITDSQVREQADSQRKRNNLTQSKFREELEKEGLNYEDYLFITRFGMEYSFFMELIISPMISVTDLEIQDLFLKKFGRQMNDPVKKYELVSFNIDKNKLNTGGLKELVSVLTKFRANGILPAGYRDIATTDLGTIEEDNLSKQVSDAVKNTTEGSFSSPILIDDRYHSFFVKNITLEAVSDLQEVKNSLEGELLDQKAKLVSWEWPNMERSKHFIKNLL